MMHELHQGIVLRVYHTKHKLSIFDAHLGKIECIPQHSKKMQRLFHGAYITYALKSWRNNYLMYDTALVAEPPYVVHQKLLFFHHVLEICYFFLALEQQEYTLFGLLKVAYTHPEIFESKLAQKLFLCHFFKEIGIYPADTRSYDPAFFSLISGPFESSVKAEDEEKVHGNLRKWLLGCISTHPYAHSLKTIDFLIKVVE
jgi:hypothetical protein